MTDADLQVAAAEADISARLGPRIPTSINNLAQVWAHESMADDAPMFRECLDALLAACNKIDATAKGLGTRE